MNKQTDFIKGYADNQGIKLYFERRGQGEPLILIAGGGGDAGYFTKLADYLKDTFTVITYDRRGYSRSTRPEANFFNIQEHVADIQAILDENGFQKAHIVGNSAGAMIALELARMMPEISEKIIVHEPPIVKILPNPKKYLRLITRTYNIALRFGSSIASNWFNMSLSLPFSVFKHVPKDFQERMIQYNNNDQLIFVELLSAALYMPDYTQIKNNKVDIYLASGKRTMKKNKYYGITSAIIAKELNCPFVEFPGHHLSYLEHTELWGEQLIEILMD